MALCPVILAARLDAQQAGGADTATAEVRGTVHATNGTPIGGITIDLVGTGRQTTTTDSGQFTVTQIRPGVYVVTASGAGWRSTQTQVRARGGVLSHLELVLTPAAATGAVSLPAVTVGGEATRTAASGPHTSPTGAADYTVTSADILNLPTADNTAVTDVLAQMPDVAIDQNQQIHIHNTEGPQFQYQIDGALVPLDINTNPPFISMIDPMFVSRIDLLDGVLPSSYSYATGGIVAIQTKNGCDSTGGDVSVFFGQRRTLEPSAQYAGCAGSASYYVSGLYDQGENAFSSATSGPNPIHDQANQGHVFGYLAVPLGSTTRLSAILSAAASNNQLPNVPNLPPEFTLTGAGDLNSGGINSYLNFRDYLGMLTLSGKLDTALSYQVTYAAHSISQQFAPDDAGELIFQGVASTATHNDLDNTLQADLTYKAARHTLSTGIYLGEYRVIADDHSLVFPVNSAGTQSSSTPIAVINDAHATNLISGLYVNDIWQIDDRLKLDMGLRWDDLTGFTDGNQIDPTINLSYAVTPQTTAHVGFARYMQVPSFQGVSPTATAAFAGTTAEGPAGISTPLTEDDFEWDVGFVHALTPRLALSQDNYYEITHHYLDTGEFGVVPIFAPFNYDQGAIWGSNIAAMYKDDNLSAYGSFTVGRNLQKGVVTGQFNFPSDELAYIDSHYIVLDHQPLYGASAGAHYRWQRFDFALDGVYSSGLRAGFADLEALPTVVQVNGSIQGTWHVPVIRTLTDRLSILNLLDRVNLVRPAEGIGIFQSSYGPRFTILDAVTIPF